MLWLPSPSLKCCQLVNNVNEILVSWTCNVPKLCTSSKATWSFVMTSHQSWSHSFDPRDNVTNTHCFIMVLSCRQSMSILAMKESSSEDCPRIRSWFAEGSGDGVRRTPRRLVAWTTRHETANPMLELEQWHHCLNDVQESIPWHLEATSSRG